MTVLSVESHHITWIKLEGFPNWKNGILDYENIRGWYDQVSLPKAWLVLEHVLDSFSLGTRSEHRPTICHGKIHDGFGALFAP